MRRKVDPSVNYLSAFLLQFLLNLQQSDSQITNSGQFPLDEPPTFVLSNFGYSSSEISSQPSLTVEITVGDPAVQGLDTTGFEYEITWFAKGDVAKRRRKVARQLTSSGNDVVERLGFSSTGNNGYSLGEEIYATFKVRYYRTNNRESSMEEFSPWSELVKSPDYKTGILVSPVGDIGMKECSENYTKITITLKTPVNCPNNNQNCVLGIQLVLKRMSGTAFYWTSRQEVAMSSCQITLDNSHMNKPIDVYMKGICDSVHEPNDTVLLRMEYTQSTNFWNSLTLSDKKIHISDTPSKWCTYQGDPHMQTFDGLSYSYFGIGDFVLFRNKELKLEINARLWPCANGASCICGMAIREGNDVLTLKGCNIDKPWKFRVTLNTVARFSSIQVLKELSTNNKFYIFLRGGAEVIVTHTYNPEVERSWVNTMIRVPDTGGTLHEGMCGNYDGIPENDLKYGGDGQDYTGNPNEFGISWRLAFNKDSWFKKTPTYISKVQHEMCSCGMRAGWWMETKPALGTRCGFYEENNFLAVRRNTEDITEILRTNGLLRRAVNDDISDIFEEEANNAGEFDPIDFTDYKVIKNLSWPTPSGKTESEVYNYCRVVIFESSGAKDCQNVTARRRVGNNTALLENCIKDIQITDQMFWSSSALSTFQTQCHEAVLVDYAEQTLTNETSSIQSDGTQAVWNFSMMIPNEVFLTCPGDCSSNGTCAKGVCTCNEGRTGKDCSIRSDQAPVLKGIYSDGLCDVRGRACKLTRVNGYGFINSPDGSLSCHVEGFEVFNSTWNLTSSPTLTSAILIDLYQVQCSLLHHPVSRDEDPYVRGTPVVGMRISISNDGKKLSKKQTIVIYDGLCLKCTVQGDCVSKNNTCLINGRCYANGDVHLYEITKSCQPDIDSRKWTYVAVTPKKQGKDTTVIVVAGVVAPLLVLIGLAVALRCWIIGARRGGAEFEQTAQEEGFFFHY